MIPNAYLAISCQQINNAVKSEQKSKLIICRPFVVMHCNINIVFLNSKEDAKDAGIMSRAEVLDVLSINTVTIKQPTP